MTMYLIMKIYILIKFYLIEWKMKIKLPVIMLVMTSLQPLFQAIN